MLYKIVKEDYFFDYPTNIVSNGTNPPRGVYSRFLDNKTNEYVWIDITGNIITNHMWRNVLNNCSAQISS